MDLLPVGSIIVLRYKPYNCGVIRKLNDVAWGMMGGTVIGVQGIEETYGEPVLSVTCFVLFKRNDK